MTVDLPNRRTGRGVRVALIDSGVNAGHPHVLGVAGGAAFDALGGEHGDYTDRLGHGTAVAAAVREKAPSAELFAIKIFDRALVTEVSALTAALLWTVKHRVHIVNLSLASTREAHEAEIRAAVKRVVAGRALLVCPLGAEDGLRLLPGSLPGVLPVQVDWDCPREGVRPALLPDGSWVCRASGYPRPIPGVSTAHNLKGLSFAVANVTGVLARVLEDRAPVSLDEAQALLEQQAVNRTTPTGV
jgi:subtilisin family serine protease